MLFGCARAALLLSQLPFFFHLTLLPDREVIISLHGACLGSDVVSQEMAEKIKNFANSDRIDSACDIQWKNNDSILYFNNRRLKISDDLLRRVFMERDGESFAELSRALRSFRHLERNVRDGLDGMIFYDGEKSFRMMSFTVGSRKVKTYPQLLKASSKTKEIERAFCSLLPPITRAP